MRYARRSDNERSACYRSERLAGLEAMEAEMEVIVQVWVYSHGEGGGFALNEAADALADAARQGATSWRACASRCRTRARCCGR